VKAQSARDDVTIAKPFITWVRKLTAIAQEIYGEFKRLNRGGDDGMVRAANSRRKQTQAFKAALAQRYRQHNRCC
jgi:hypothetical protein